MSTDVPHSRRWPGGLFVVGTALLAASVASAATVSFVTLRSRDILSVPQVAMQCGLSKVKGKQALLCWAAPQKRGQLTVAMFRDRVVVTNGGLPLYSGVQPR